MIRTTFIGRTLSPLAGDRWLLTILTTLGLWGGFIAYSRSTRPLLKSEITIHQSLAPEDEPRLPVVDDALVAASLPNEDWVSAANYQITNEESRIYFHHRKLLDENKTLQVSPFALVVLAKPDAEDQTPITMVCEKANLYFNDEFDITNIKPEELQGGALHGTVKITGPKRLAIVGSDFQFSNALRIWSDRSVAFRFDKHVGDAHGVEIRLSGDPKKEGQGLLSASEVETISLRQNVRMNIYLEDEEHDLLRIRSKGSFEFDFDSNLAEFHDTVAIERPKGKYNRETLDCDRLRMQFAERIKIEADQTETRRMEPIRLSADGRSVVLKSDEEKLRATASQFTYDVELKKITLIGAIGTVNIQRDNQTFVGKRIDIIHDDDSNVVSAIANGPGSMVERKAGTNDVEFAAGWQERLVYGDAPEGALKLVTMIGKAIVQQPTDKTNMFGDKIRMWLKAEEKSTEKQTQPAEDGSDKRQRFSMQPQQLVADGNVRIDSPQLKIGGDRPAEKLTANFVDTPATPDGGSGTSVITVSRKKDKDANSRLNDKLNLDANEITIRMQRPANGKGDTNASDVWLSGDVVVKHNRPDQDPTVFTGDGLHLRNDGDQKQFVTLRGLPARVFSQGRTIEGERIEFDRGTGKAEVVGKGHIQLPIDRDMEGNPLKVPQPLDVIWKTGMRFDGQTANFYGDVRARLRQANKQIQEVRSAQMVVKFDRQIDMRARADKQPEISNIRFIGNHTGRSVDVSNSQYENGDVSAAQVGRFLEFTIDQKSGDVFGQGPGWIKSWRPGRKGRANLSPISSVKANTPLQSTSGDLEYAKIDFVGRMKGNFNRRITEFYDEVRVCYGPVTKIEQEIDPDDDQLLQLPKNSGLMRCNILELKHRKSDGEKTGHINLRGNGNVVLEGHDFRAQADQISFDQLKKLFTLQSFGRTNATIWRQSAVGAQSSYADGRRIIFNPSTGELKHDGGQNVMGISDGLPIARPASGSSR